MTSDDGHVSECLAEETHSVRSSEQTAGCQSQVQDEYFSTTTQTPPLTPHEVPSFRDAISTQLEMLQQILVSRYENDISVLREENLRLHQRLLASKDEGHAGQPVEQLQRWEGPGLQDAGCPTDCLHKSSVDASINALQDAPSSAHRTPVGSTGAPHLAVDNVNDLQTQTLNGPHYGMPHSEVDSRSGLNNDGLNASDQLHPSAQALQMPPSCQECPPSTPEPTGATPPTSKSVPVVPKVLKRSFSSTLQSEYHHAGENVDTAHEHTPLLRGETCPAQTLSQKGADTVHGFMPSLGEDTADTCKDNPLEGTRLSSENVSESMKAASDEQGTAGGAVIKSIDDSQHACGMKSISSSHGSHLHLQDAVHAVEHLSHHKGLHLLQDVVHKVEDEQHHLAGSLHSFSAKMHHTKVLKEPNCHDRDVTAALYSPECERTKHKKAPGNSSKPRPSKKSSSDIDLEHLTTVQKIVFHQKFDIASGLLIMCNAIAFSFKLQYDGFDCRHAVRPEYDRAAETWPGSETAFKILEYIFTVLFVGELVLRFYAFGLRRSVRQGWMWFDSIIIGFGLFDTLGGGALGINTSSLRLFRLVRLVRVFKILQSMALFDSLFLLIKALQASVKAMTFSFLILLVIQVVSGMFLCQMLQPFILDESQDPKVRDDVFNFFGTFTRSMLTMFEITMANWVTSCRLLSEGVNELWALYFVLYRCCACFAIIKVISAVFITETNRVLASDDELTLMKLRREKHEYSTKLRSMFEAMDLDHDNNLSWSELQSLLADEKAAECLVTLGFAQHDFDKLFWLIDSGSGKIPIADFLSKVGKLKGVSKSIDTLTLLKLTHRVEMLVQDILQKDGLRGPEDAAKARESKEETEAMERMDND